MDDTTSSALVRAVTWFAVVLVAGSTMVYAIDRATGGGGLSATPATTTSSSPGTPPPGNGTPDAWLAWVPGGLPAGFSSGVTAVPAVTNVSTATADIAWLTGSVNAAGKEVDRPADPYMIPIDTTGAEPSFASFMPQPERRLVQALQPGEGILSESEAALRGLGNGASLTFEHGATVSIVGTLPDVLMGGYELLVTRATGIRIGVTHERYLLFDVRSGAVVSSATIAQKFQPYLPVGAPYPVVEIRPPGTTKYLRADDRELPPVLLKQHFGEFAAFPDPVAEGSLHIDPAWVEGHIASEDVPLLGTVTCHTEVIALLRRAMSRLAAQGHATDVHDVGSCYEATAAPDDPEGPLTARAFGASIELNRGRNTPGESPDQSASLIEVMTRVGFGWAGRDAYPQGALFRFRRAAGAAD